MFSWLCNFDEKSYNIAVIFFVKVLFLTKLCLNFAVLNY